MKIRVHCIDHGYHEVDALGSSGGLAVTPAVARTHVGCSFVDEEDFCVVTHVASGLRISPSLSRAAARRLMFSLTALGDIDWTRGNDDLRQDARVQDRVRVLLRALDEDKEQSQ